jgi:hypothetical protein
MDIVLQWDNRHCARFSGDWLSRSTLELFGEKNSIQLRSID